MLEDCELETNTVVPYGAKCMAAAQAAAASSTVQDNA